MTPDYKKENELRKKAIQEEERFLKKDVIGQGADMPATYQNLQGDMEQAIENEDTTSSDN